MLILSDRNIVEGRIAYFSYIDPETQEVCEQVYNEYALKDHLGNTRIRFTDKGNDGQFICSPENPCANEIFGSNHYYPFGMETEGPWVGQSGVENHYTYNGKEEVSSVGLLDYGARYYDASIGRFTTVDPLAEKYVAWSPYNYVGNNPIKRVDINGESWGLAIKALKAGRKLFKAYKKAGGKLTKKDVKDIGIKEFYDTYDDFAELLDGDLSVDDISAIADIAFGTELNNKYGKGVSKTAEKAKDSVSKAKKTKNRKGKEHTKNATERNRNKHEEANSRRAKEQNAADQREAKTKSTKDQRSNNQRKRDNPDYKRTGSKNSN